MLLDIPPFLRISAAKRRKAWADYHPLPAETPVEVLPQQSEAAIAAKEAKRDKTMKRIRALKSRKAREAMEQELAGRMWYINGVPMHAAKFARIIAELPTESMRALFRSQYSRYRPIVVAPAGKRSASAKNRARPASGKLAGQRRNANPRKGLAAGRK